MANISFALNDIDMGTYNVYVGYEGNPLMEDELTPDINLYTESMNGKDGIYFFGQNFKERVIKIPCYVEGVTETQKIQIQKLLTVINNPQKLVFDLTLYKYIWVVTRSATSFKFKLLDGLYYGVFTLELLGINSFYESYYSALDYETNPSYETSEYSIYENFDIEPEDVPTCSYASVTSGFSFELYNHGNYPAKVKITAVGSCTNMSIINATTSQAITITTLASGSTLVIDSSKGQVTVNAVLASSIASGTFIELASGMNDLQITCTAMNLSTLTFNYKHTYI